MIGEFLRKGLVVFQFAVSLIFITGTVIIFNQMNYINAKDLGFEKDFIISLNADETLKRNYKSVKVELVQNSHITDVSASIFSPGTFSGLPISYVPEGTPEDESITLYLSFVSENFFEFFGIEILTGRSFSGRISTDFGSAIILNEAAVKLLGWDSPLGKKIVYEGWGVNGTVIGVVEDFHSESLHNNIKPLVFQYTHDSYDTFHLKLQPGSISNTLSFIQTKLSEFSPEFIFRYSFIEDRIELLYRKENKMGEIFKSVSCGPGLTLVFVNWCDILPGMGTAGKGSRGL